MRSLLLTMTLVGCTGEIVTPPPTSPTCGEPARLKRLNATEYRAIVTQLFDGGVRGLEVPFAQARRTDVFSTWASQATISEYEVDDVWAAADVIATEWTSRQSKLCTGSGRTLECLRQVYGPVLMALWSRTPSDEELGALAASLNEAERELAPKQAVVSTLRPLLMSPDFLFRSELGVDGRLRSTEVATALSFTLWERPPDAQLRSLADSDGLTSTDVIAAETRRLLERPADVPALRHFLRELLQYENAKTTFKDAATFPFHRAGELVDDTEKVVERLVTEHARSGLHRALLTSDLVYVRPLDREELERFPQCRCRGVRVGSDAIGRAHAPVVAGRDE